MIISLITKQFSNTAMWHINTTNNFTTNIDKINFAEANYGDKYQIITPVCKMMCKIK